MAFGRGPARRRRWAGRRHPLPRRGRWRRHPVRTPLVAIVGHPNVGKSQLFNRLTGAHVTVSNYPGTTVDVVRGRLSLFPDLPARGSGEARGPARGPRRLDRDLALVDTPGMYSLLPLTEEERVARRILFDEQPDLIVHVVDAKDLPRMLPMTLELVEAGLPLFLVVNMIDEARQIGLSLDLPTLARRLGVPVYATVGTTGEGVRALREGIIAYVYPDHRLRPGA